MSQEAWRKSSYSNGPGHCVEVLKPVGGGRASIRDSKQGQDSPVLNFSIGAFDSLLQIVRV